MVVTKKIEDFIYKIVAEVEKEGKTKFSTCDYRGWDRDIWDFRHTIFEKLRARNYGVSASMNWGVMDVTVILKF